MARHLHHSLEELKKSVLTLGGLVEESIEKATKAFKKQDVEMGNKILNDDDAIDQMELKIEDECLKLLALYQPVAEDLRFVCAVMKINNDLERLGDLAASMAIRGGRIGRLLPPEVADLVDHMAVEVNRMLRRGLQAFVDRDPTVARDVVRDDDRIDQLHHTLIDKIIAFMKASPSNVDAGVQLIWVSRNLERVADHITNIAEDIVYMAEGETIRHQMVREGGSKGKEPPASVITLKPEKK